MMVPLTATPTILWAAGRRDTCSPCELVRVNDWYWYVVAGGCHVPGVTIMVDRLVATLIHSCAAAEEMTAINAYRNPDGPGHRPLRRAP